MYSATYSIILLVKYRNWGINIEHNRRQQIGKFKSLYVYIINFRIQVLKQEMNDGITAQFYPYIGIF